MRKLIVVLAALALVATGAVAYASIPGPDGVVHACYKNSNPAQGALIAIDSAASCPSGYTALNWNQTGPVGPQGPEGPQGLAATSTVATRIIHYDVSDATTCQTCLPAGLTSKETVACPSETHAINGGVLQTQAPATWGQQLNPPIDAGGAWTSPEAREHDFPYSASPTNDGLPRPVDDEGSWRMVVSVQFPFDQNGVVPGQQATLYDLDVTLYAICL
jgi:hypothetical protein